jgi:hypothetical protein
VLIAYELGGPDAIAYAVLSGELAGPTNISGHEPRNLAAGVFGDGDFVVAIIEDESQALMMWNVRNDGSLVHGAPIFPGEGSLPASNRFSIFPSGPQEV